MSLSVCPFRHGDRGAIVQHARSQTIQSRKHQAINANLQRCLRSATACSRFPAPIGPEAGAMPADHRFRFEDFQSRSIRHSDARSHLSTGSRGLRRVLALRFRSGGMVLFIPWRVAAERRAGSCPSWRPRRRRFLFGFIGWWPSRPS